MTSSQVVQMRILDLRVVRNDRLRRAVAGGRG